MQSNLIEAILLGYSGHGMVVAEAAWKSGIRLLGYANSEELSLNPYSLAFLGDETKEDFDWNSADHYILGIGSNAIRARIAERINKRGKKCLTIIHPDASLAGNVVLGQGCFVARNVSVNPLVQIGNNVILNTACSIDHECQIEDNVHIAPGVVLAGNVKVGKGTFIGANTVVKEGVSIGEGVVVGAGSVVIKNIPAGKKYVGNPAKEL